MCGCPTVLNHHNNNIPNNECIQAFPLGVMKESSFSVTHFTQAYIMDGMSAHRAMALPHTHTMLKMMTNLAKGSTIEKCAMQQ